MAFNSTIPRKMQLTGAGSGSPKRRRWWKRIIFWGDSGHPTLMKEQDLDHLGTLHDATLHTKRR